MNSYKRMIIKLHYSLQFITMYFLNFYFSLAFFWGVYYYHHNKYTLNVALAFLSPYYSYFVFKIFDHFFVVCLTLYVFVCRFHFRNFCAVWFFSVYSFVGFSNTSEPMVRVRWLCVFADAFFFLFAWLLAFCSRKVISMNKKWKRLYSILYSEY